MVSVSYLLRNKGNDVWSVSPDTTVIDTLKMLADKDIGALMVMKNGEMVGIVSERDFVRAIARTGQCLPHSTVENYMIRDVYTITPDQSIDLCMQIMTEKHIRHLPVVEKGKLIGVITIGDVVRELISNKEETIIQLENYIQGRGYSQ
jgi:CBS domain-containing protein